MAMFDSSFRIKLPHEDFMKDPLNMDFNTGKAGFFDGFNGGFDKSAANSAKQAYNDFGGRRTLGFGNLSRNFLGAREAIYKNPGAVRNGMAIGAGLGALNMGIGAINNFREGNYGRAAISAAGSAALGYSAYRFATNNYAARRTASNALLGGFKFAAAGRAAIRSMFK